MKTSKLLAIALAALLFSACNNNDDIIDGNQSKGEGATVNIVLENGTKGINTRETSPGTEEESHVSKMEIFIFDEQGNPDGKTPYLSFDTYRSKTTVNIANYGKIRIVVIANSSIGKEVASTYAALQELLATQEFVADATTPKHNARTIPTEGFEMSGEQTITILGDSKENTVTVGLDRLVSKFDKPVINSDEVGFFKLSDLELEAVWGKGTDIANEDMKFTFDGYALINGVNKSLLLNRTDWNIATNIPPATWELKWAEWYAENKDGYALKHLNSGFGADEYTNSYSGMQGESWFINDEKPVFVYENSPEIIDINVGKGYDPKMVYAFIIKGTLTVGENEDEKTAVRYWRVNLIPESFYHIYRNKSYAVTITSLKSGGYATPEEAEKNNSIVPMEDAIYMDMIVFVKPWGLVTSSTEM